jgi:hypothetical protein
MANNNQRLQSRAYVLDGDRAIKTANIMMRHGSTRNNNERIVTSGNDLRIQQK